MQENPMCNLWNGRRRHFSARTRQIAVLGALIFVGSLPVGGNAARAQGGPPPPGNGWTYNISGAYQVIDYNTINGLPSYVKDGTFSETDITAETEGLVNVAPYMYVSYGDTQLGDNFLSGDTGLLPPQPPSIGMPGPTLNGDSLDSNIVAVWTPWESGQTIPAATLSLQTWVGNTGGDYYEPSAIPAPYSHFGYYLDSLGLYVTPAIQQIQQPSDWWDIVVSISGNYSETLASWSSASQFQSQLTAYDGHWPSGLIVTTSSGTYGTVYTFIAPQVDQYVDYTFGTAYVLSTGNTNENIGARLVVSP
jgi:hypothetical protein